MEKQTENVITREFIEKELSFYNTADIRSNIVFLASVSILFIPLTFILVWCILFVFQKLILKIIFCVLIGLVISVPVWVALLYLRNSLSERKWLQSGTFEVTVRELSYKTERVVQRHIEEFFSFSDFKDIAVSNTTYQLSSLGDEFYIIHYPKKDRIK